MASRNRLLVGCLLLVAAANALSTQPSAQPCGRAAARTPPPSRPAVRPLHAVAAASLSVLLLGAPPVFADSATIATKSASEFKGAVEGFEDFAAQGGKMEANPSCFFDECKEQTTSCFTNPVRVAAA